MGNQVPGTEKATEPIDTTLGYKLRHLNPPQSSQQWACLSSDTSQHSYLIDDVLINITVVEIPSVGEKVDHVSHFHGRESARCPPVGSGSSRIWSHHCSSQWVHGGQPSPRYGASEYDVFRLVLIIQYYDMYNIFFVIQEKGVGGAQVRDNLRIEPHRWALLNSAIAC